jgi:UTP--glucose-1-phosphate uridylyltransferase
MKGLGHAILTGKPLVGNQPFAVILADDLCVNKNEGVLSQMVALYEKYQCSIVAIEEIDPKQTDKYGVIAGDEIEPGIYRVSTMVEKPAPQDAPTNLAIIGRYILTPDIFDILQQTKPGKGGEIQITDALMQQALEGKVIAYKFNGKRYDCGSIDGYVQATMELYNEMKETL